MNLRNFFNNVSKKNRIYYAEEIGRMKPKKFKELEAEINYQINNLGIPREADLRNSKDVYSVNDFMSNNKSYYSFNNQGSYAGNSFVTPEEKIRGSMYQYGLAPFAPEAARNVRNGMHNLNDAMKDKNTFVLDSFDEIQNKEIRDILNNSGVLANTRGIFYNSESDAAKNMSKAKVLDDFILKNYDKLKNRELNVVPINFDFDKSKDSYLDKDKLDPFAAYQHATLYKPHIDNEGNFNTMLVDYYDFEPRQGTSEAVKANNWGYSMQEKEKLENYYILMYIRKKLESLL